MRRALVGFALGALIAPCFAASIATSYGPVDGVSDGRVEKWLGLPYAAPPVGELRWRAPQPAKPWTELRKADAFGAPCMQIGTVYGPPPAGKAWGLTNVEAFGQPVGSEDCLTLNIWRPVASGALPVIVFVHGGGGIAGYSADPAYEGSKLALAANAIVVTINLRLSVFASFVHPALASGDRLSDSGQFGMLDIIAALRFVHDNIAAFGGDPDNVTLSGESAGAIAVYMMMASPLAKGLFHKAIVMSGLFGDPAPRGKALEFSGLLVSRLIAQDHLSEPPKDLQRYLRSKSAGEILTVLHREKLKGRGAPGDDVVLPVELNKAFEEGRYNRVPTMVGTTRDEAKLLAGAFKPADTERFTIMQTPARAAAATSSDLIAPWLLPGVSSSLYDAYTGAMTWLLLTGVEKSIKRLAMHAPAVYRYRFDWDEEPEPWHTVYGACHAIDIPYLFGNFSPGFFAPFFDEHNRAGREALAQTFMRTVGAFARTGDPNGAQLAQPWPVWTEASPQVLHFDASDAALQLSVH
jgi:para-nitrobenzyl esterase